MISAASDGIAGTEFSVRPERMRRRIFVGVDDCTGGAEVLSSPTPDRHVSDPIAENGVCMSIDRNRDPIDQFKEWLAAAERSEPNDPNAMTLATATAEGVPSARMVLLKGVDARGFAFYTNLGSRKAAELAANPRAALCFHWKSLRRQVRVEGQIERVGDDEADAYFATRARVSQIGAWASKQSQPLIGRFELEARVAKYAAKFHLGAVPRPPYWSGYWVIPGVIEFWEDRPFRLHMRILFRRSSDGWSTEELYP
jgi:pyridoxamine 5'-phosphate oxidase